MFFSSDFDLPNTLVNKIAEDKNGMLWIATEDGLCKYNGSRFVTYRNQKGNPNSLQNDFVRTICTDKKGNICIGTVAGFQVYRPLTDDFTPVIKAPELGISGGNANQIVMLNNGDFLVVGGVCYTVKNVGGDWKAIKNVLTDKVHDAHRAIQANDGTIFASVQNGSVYRFDTSGKMSKVLTSEGQNCNVSMFCKAPDGRIYAGCSDYGIYIYNQKRKCLELIPGTEFLTQVCDIKPIPNTSTLCIGTDGVGVRFFDTKNHQFIGRQQLSDPLVDVSSQKAHSIYINKDGDMWLALYQKGVFMTTNATQVFSYVGKRSLRNDLIGDRCVTSLLQTHDGNIWATTDNGGLYGFTSDFTSINKFPVENRQGGVPPTMLGLFEDSSNRVWFGSYGRGGGVVDVSTGQCYYVQVEGVKGFEYSIYGYVEDKRGQIWAASMGSGILKYDEASHIMKKVPVNYTQWSGCIFYDRPNDVIYAGTYGGVIVFKPTDKSLKTKVISGESIVYSISRISSDMLAFSSNSGLIIYNTKTGKTKYITRNDGLPSNNVYSAQIGNDGHVWISSTGGLTSLDLKNMNTETYTMRDGLQGNEFYKNASIISRDGRLWFGGINGITTFMPRDVNRRQHDCVVRVVGLAANGNSILPDEDGKYILSEDLRTFTIELATLPLYMTHRVVYSYKLDNGEWVNLPVPQNNISFSNLGYGSHTMYTRTAIDGKNSTVTETKIYIMYPWYLRWWAILMWLLLLGAVSFYVHHSLLRRRRMRERMMQDRREQEMKEGKLQFFMNIVHDLRTPLTLIATPLQKLQTNDSDSGRQRLYGIMERNTDRLLRLTNEIMDLRKIDRGKMELHCQEADVSRHIRDIIGTMSDIAETRHLKLSLHDNTSGNVRMSFDVISLEKILVNLLSNALKYTEEGGKVDVVWDIVKGELPGVEDSVSDIAAESENLTFTGQLLKLSVIDNGIGISAEDKLHIFDRFYQVRVNDKHIKGTGIGLNLVQALVSLHQGEISVSDNPEGKGTCFSVVIPELIEEGSVPVKEIEISKSAVVAAEDEEVDESVGESIRSYESRKHSRKTVLIVDDDDEIRNFLCEELSGLYNIIESSNGKTAFAELNKNNVDIVISDVMMPEIDGIELTKMIRQNVRFGHLPIILLTAKSSDQDRIEGLQATADAYVTKPFNLALLQTLISNLLLRQDKLRNTFKGNELPVDKIDTPEVSSADDKLLERLVKVINDNLSNPELTSEFLAREVGLSRVHLYRKLKELTNQTATNYIRNIRLTKAAEMLRKNKATVSEVAYLVGFRTPTHFSTAFKDLYGMTPKEYIKKKN